MRLICVSPLIIFIWDEISPSVEWGIQCDAPNSRQATGIRTQIFH